jgi:hypothetical protein
VYPDIETGPATVGPTPPLFSTLLGHHWPQLPKGLTQLHSPAGATQWQGRAKVTGASNWLGRRVAQAFGFPGSQDDCPVVVGIHAIEGGEVWVRQMGDGFFSSTLSRGAHPWHTLLVERFGPFQFGLALVWHHDRLHYVIQKWRYKGWNLPAWCMPSGDSFEHMKDERCHFHVEISSPLTGLIVRYEGWLAPV